MSDDVDGGGAEDDDAPEPSAHDRPSSRRFALVLVVLIAAWNVYGALTARSTHEVIAPTLFAAGAGALGVAIAGPERLRIAAFFVGAACCIAAFGASV